MRLFLAYLCLAFVVSCQKDEKSLTQVSHYASPQSEEFLVKYGEVDHYALERKTAVIAARFAEEERLRGRALTRDEARAVAARVGLRAQFYLPVVGDRRALGIILQRDGKQLPQLVFIRSDKTYALVDASALITTIEDELACAEWDLDDPKTETDACKLLPIVPQAVWHPIFGSDGKELGRNMGIEIHFEAPPTL